MINRKLITVAILGIATVASVEARELYGLTTTSWEEGNARVVSLNIEELSSSSPAAFKEISTVEHAADFMAGTMVNGKYFCFYNTFNQETDLSLQHFGTLDMKTGEFTAISEENHAVSDNVTDMMDLTYDPVGGGLLGLDRQFSYGTYGYVSTIQNVSMRSGALSEVVLLDRKYMALCADGEGGFYMATVEASSGDTYEAAFYKANERFVTTPMVVTGDLTARSSFAHSMVTDGENLYFATGDILIIVNLADKSSNSYPLEKELYGISLEMSGNTGLNKIDNDDVDVQYFGLDGSRITNPSKGQMVIVRKGAKSFKVIF